MHKLAVVCEILSDIEGVFHSFWRLATDVTGASKRARSGDTITDHEKVSK